MDSKYIGREKRNTLGQGEKKKVRYKVSMFADQSKRRIM
jgi:hypothetical protein